MLIELAFCFIILVALVLIATIDMAFSQLSDVSLRRIAGDSDEASTSASAAFLREVLAARPRFRFILSSTIQFLMITFTVLITVLVIHYTLDVFLVIAYSLAIGLATTIIFRQLVPRLIIRSNAEAFLLALLPGVKPLYRVGNLLTAPFGRLFAPREQAKIHASATPESADDRADNSADDLQALMEVGEAEGIIEEDERELIETMVEFNDTIAGDIMTPRTEICGLPLNSTIRAARDMIIDQKYSRLPVYSDSIDNIEGVIYVRDLLQAWSTGREDDSVATILRDAYFVPETKSASDLLKSMQAEHVQLAIVIDEYGGVAGILTVEDIIEEIFGEIEDEDTGHEEIIEIIEGEGGYWDVLGSTEIDKIERLLDIEIEDDDFTTIAGLITSEAGYVPKVGEKLSMRGLEFEILRGDDKRLSLIRLRPAAAASGGGAADAA